MNIKNFLRNKVVEKDVNKLTRRGFLKKSSFMIITTMLGVGIPFADYEEPCVRLNLC